MTNKFVQYKSFSSALEVCEFLNENNVEIINMMQNGETFTVFYSKNTDINS